MVASSNAAAHARCFARLAPHLDLTRVALTGGVAIDLHLSGAERRTRTERRPAHDLDLIAESVDVVSPNARDEFLVSHFHRPHRGYQKFLVQLVDPLTGIRVDVFPDSRSMMLRASPMQLGGVCVNVLDLDALLEHKLTLLDSASPERPVDEKHFADAVLLAQRCGRWIPDVPASALGQPPYGRDPAMTCARCEASRHPDFPLASKREILAVLGYV